MEAGLKIRSYADSLMMARMSEELDAISNIKKEDISILTGLTNRVVITGAEDKKTLK